MSLAEFDAHTQQAASEIASRMASLTAAAQERDLPAIGVAANELEAVTGDELDWLSEAERTGAISEDACYFEMASAYALGITYLDLAANDALRYADTRDTSYAASVAELSTQGSDALQRSIGLRPGAEARCS